MNTHTVNTHCEHTPGAVDSIYAAAPGVQLGVRCLAQGHLNRGIGGEFLPDRDSSLQPFEYKSYSPTIRPQLTPVIWWMNDELCIYIVLFVYCCTPKTLYNHVGGSLLNHIYPIMFIIFHKLRFSAECISLALHAILDGFFQCIMAFKFEFRNSNSVHSFGCKQDVELQFELYWTVIFYWTFK